VASETTSRRPTGRALPSVRPELLTWIALAVLLLVAAVFLFHETRGTTFWFDEWRWVLNRQGGDLDTFLEPHNEHLSLIPIAIYKVLFATAGLEHYGVYRAMVIAGHLTCAALAFVYMSRRVGGVAALCGTALLLFLGPGWQNIIWPFQIGWLISLMAGIAALLALDRGDRRGDVAASVLIGVSLASSGLGVAIALGALVEVASVRRRWRDLWIVAMPLAPYAVWWLAYRPAGLVRSNIDQTFDFTAEAAAGTLSALAGLAGSGVPTGVDALQWGRPLAVIALVGLLWALGRRTSVPPRVRALLTILLAFWVLTGLRRATYQDPDTSRYLYVGALFVLLILAELARGVSVTQRIAVVLAVAVAAATLSNAGTVRDAGRYLRSQAEVARADLAALELARNSLDPGYVAAHFPGAPFVSLRAGPYLAAASDYGSPAYSLAELIAAPEPARRVADAELVRIHGVGPRAARSAPAPALGASPEPLAVVGGTTTERRGCLQFRPAPVRAADAPPTLELTVPRAGLLIRTSGAPAQVDVRRLAADYSSVTPNTVMPSAAATLRIPSDSAPQPWRARISPQERVSVCALR